MQYRSLIVVAALLVSACGDDSNNENNDSNGTNNTSSNNTANNDSNATNNSSNATNNDTSNATNNANNTSNATNSQTNAGVDFISADVDGTTVLADAEEGGVEPMGAVVQLRKTTGEASSPIQIFRISIPAVEVTSYDCSSPDVGIIYSELNGQLINNWTSMDTCAIDISAVDPKVVGTFSATTSDGSTTLELTDGEFMLTP